MTNGVEYHKINLTVKYRKLNENAAKWIKICHRSQLVHD